MGALFLGVECVDRELTEILLMLGCLQACNGVCIPSDNYVSQLMGACQTMGRLLHASLFVLRCEFMIIADSLLRADLLAEISEGRHIPSSSPQVPRAYTPMPSLRSRSSIIVDDMRPTLTAFPCHLLYTAVPKCRRPEAMSTLVNPRVKIRIPISPETLR